jgi:hypothetical protein
VERRRQVEGVVRQMVRLAGVGDRFDQFGQEQHLPDQRKLGGMSKELDVAFLEL